MKRLFLLGVAIAVCALSAASGVGAAGHVDGVWVNGTIHNLLVTGPAAAGARAMPLYVIAPVSATHPLHPLADAKTHGFGAHDHVVSLARPSVTFHGACDLTLVVPGPKAVLGKTVAARLTLTPAGSKPLLYAALLGGNLTPLNAASRIKAAAHAGLAALVDTHNLVACTVSPR
ncbi:MAG TPA: hypothetical protein VIC05_08255 [Solirubrobacteraceae bacterium]|jgi:hypothetical protein